MIADDKHPDRAPVPASGTASDGETAVQLLQRRELEAALERERILLRTMIELIPAILYAKDAHSRFIACNELVARGMGTTAAELIGKTDFEFFPRDMAEGFFADEQAIIRTGLPLIDREELILNRDSGTVRQISTSKIPLRDSAGNVIGIVGIGRDITERKRADERIRYLATHDSLTELPNRTIFSERLNALIGAADKDTRFAVLFVDLDHFKLINDTLGHEAGDALLKQTAARLLDSVRPGDLVARLGGDEFVVLCMDAAELEDIDAVALKIVFALTRPAQLLDQECRVGASIGIAIYPTDGDSEQVLMKCADTAMYTAKQEGKNNYRFFSGRLRTASLERRMLENELRRAIGRGEFLLLYLAKFDLKSRCITGAEALLRWHHPDLGIIAPKKFIPLAEETGLIVPIGNWVLKTACAQHMAWQREGLPPLCISVNLTPRQFNDEHLLATVLSALEAAGMAANMLEIEISETTLMQDSERNAGTLAALKRAGVRLAIDNFGASYVSLANIQKFPINTLKVDRSLLRDFEQNPDNRLITEAIIALGKSLSLTVIAEGVETRRQAAFLRDQACDAMQGFYVNEPAPADEFGRLLRYQAEMSGRNSDRSQE
jgi:diguanylate cyclase (GGDEF)-like protein/PAS domain S-box-containing protein